MSSDNSTWTCTDKPLAVEMAEVCATSDPTKPALYDAIVCIINCVLQPDNEVQRQVIDKLKQMQVIEEYPLVVCQIIGAEDQSIHVRELASVFLKNYLNEILNHTQQNNALFHKSFGKCLILQLIQFLTDNTPALKECLSCCIAILLCLGFWADVTILLNDMTKQDDEEDIANAVLVLNKAIDEPYLGIHEYAIIEHHWFDVLLDVLKRTNTLSATKTRAIQPMFLLMKHLGPNLNYAPECLARIIEELDKALNEPYSISCDFAFRTEILKFLNNCVEEFNEYCNVFIPPILPSIGKLLTVCCEQYKSVIRGLMPPKDESEGDDPTNFYDLIGGLLQFIMNLIDMPYFDVLIEDLENLIYCVYLFMACHHGMETQLYSDITEKDHLWSLRETCSQIITYSLHKIDSRQKNGKAIYFKKMHSVFEKMINELEPEALNSPIKVYYVASVTESMMFGIGLIKEKFVPMDEEFVFPLEFYLNYWSSMISCDNWMVEGRILWLGGVFCLEISASVMECHLKYILRNLGADNTHILVPSAEALCSYLKSFKLMSAEKQFLITHVAPQVLTLLIAISKTQNKFPLHQTLNALGYLIKSQNKLARENIDQLEGILVKITTTCFNDPCVMKEINFICAKLAQMQGFKILIHDKFLTFLQYLIHNLEPKYMKHDLDKAFDILNTVCIYSPTLDEYLILQLFLGAATRISFNKDRDEELDESAGKVLIALIVKREAQIQYIATMPRGITLIAEFPQLLETLLQPDVELPNNVLGRLVITSILALPNVMAPHYESILRNVITSSAKPHTKNLRTNWSIFIFICMIRTTDTVNYLSVLPGPHGGSALNFIMRLWQPEYFHSVDSIDRKIMALSMVQILQHCLDNQTEHGKMIEVLIPFDRPNDSSPTGEVFNGLEYLYYLLIQCILYEEKTKIIKPPRSEPYDFEDFAEDSSVRDEDDDLFLFHSHPFNINTVNHIVNFLKRGSEPYFSVLKRFMPQSVHIILRDLGCNVPEPAMNVQEAME